MAPSFPGGPRSLPAGRGKPSGPPSSLPARGGGVSDVLIIHIFAERALRGGRRRRHISHVHSRTHMYTRSPGRRSHCARWSPGSRAPLWGGPPRTGEEWRRLPLSPPQVHSPSNPPGTHVGFQIQLSSPGYTCLPNFSLPRVVCVCLGVGRGTATNNAPARISFRLAQGSLLLQRTHTHHCHPHPHHTLQVAREKIGREGT